MGCVMYHYPLSYIAHCRPFNSCVSHKRLHQQQRVLHIPKAFPKQVIEPEVQRCTQRDPASQTARTPECSDAAFLLECVENGPSRAECFGEGAGGKFDYSSRCLIQELDELM